MKSPDETARAIIEAAEELFARYGFKKTSIDDIARAARIGKGSVYLHFASKEELFAQIVKQVSDRILHTLTAAVKRGRAPAEKLRAFLETSVTAVAAIVAEYHLNEETMMELIPMGMSLRQEYLARAHSLLVEVLRDGVSSGAFAVKHPHCLATGIMSCLQGLDATAAQRPHSTETRAGLDQLFSVLLRGLRPARMGRTG
ncbi:MAG TPA: TetR/AcrR family transcriptional regulator [Anaeromyxobacteraceae bacterium]|nr:TetR/AcrR family transcriptional regulator [Anaeromyxobacteraceae bacterium]